MNVVCTLVIVVGYVTAKSPATTEAYLDSFTIQDSCQFSLCGPEYSQEFLLGNSLKAISKDDVRMVMNAAVIDFKVVGGFDLEQMDRKMNKQTFVF